MADPRIETWVSEADDGSGWWWGVQLHVLGLGSGQVPTEWEAWGEAMRALDAVAAKVSEAHEAARARQSDLPTPVHVKEARARWLEDFRADAGKEEDDAQ